MESEKTATRAVALALVVLPILAFAPGLTSPLTRYDDHLYVGRAELTQGLAGLASLWRGDQAWRGEFIEYFPLRDTVYWLLFQGWERLPLAYHLASLFFHVAATLLVFFLLRRIGPSFWVAAAAALLFAVHPIHIESVTWTAGLKDPLYTCFVLGSLLAYSRYRVVQRPALYALTLALLIGGLLVKSMALSTPLLLLALERWVAPRAAWRTVLVRLAGPAAICAVFLLEFLAIGRLNRVSSELHGGNWVSHLVLTAWAQVVYARQALFPASFRLIYCFEPASSLTDVRFLAGVGLLLALGVAVFAWRKNPLRLFCLGFYFACLLPVSNLIPFPAVVADRYLYAASVGVCLLVASLLDTAVGRLKSLALVLIVGGLTVTTAMRSAIWQDEEALWREGDEDPVCLVDPEFPAGQVHYLRYKSAKDDATRLLALERGIAAKGMQHDTFGLGCESLIEGALLAETMGDHARAERWAKRATRSCGWNPKLWVAVLRVTVHREPAIAATAAERVYRQQPSPMTNLFRVLTRLELQQSAEQSRALVAIVAGARETTCPVLATWAREVGAVHAPSLCDALAVCEPPAR